MTSNAGLSRSARGARQKVDALRICGAGASGRMRTAMRRTRQIGFWALVAAVVAPCSAAHAQTATDTLTRDNFPIGASDGALCQVQSELSNPALSSMFDRAWTIVCRDAAQPVGQIFMLRNPADAAIRIARRQGAAECDAQTHESPLAGASLRSCRMPASGLSALSYSVERGGVLFVVEGIAAYDDALRIGLASILSGTVEPGTIHVATTSVGDAEALARVQVASLPVDRALAEGYRRNNSGDFAEAAVFFEALERRGADAQTGLDPSEFTLNRALQLSNLGNFAEADRLFTAVEAQATTDIVQRRLRRNFRAIDALNQRDFAGALGFLDQPLAPIPVTITPAPGVIAITPAIASGINADAGTRVLTQVAGDDRLTPQERALLIDAQASQLRGTIERLSGNPAAARSALDLAMAQALSVRDGRVTSIVRLRSQILGEMALVEESDGRLTPAEARLREGIRLLEVEYPETVALAAARARFAAFLTRHDRNEDALGFYRQVVSALTAQRRQLTGLYNQMAPYYRILVDRQARDPAATAEFFAAVQLLVRPGVADTQAVLARELSAGSGEAATLFRQANNLNRDIERARIELARLNAIPSDSEVAALRAEAQVRIDNLSAQQTIALAGLAQFPQYRAVEQDSLALGDLQAMLHSGEAYAKLTVVGDAVYGLLVTPTSARAWRTNVSSGALDTTVDRIRSTISVYEAGQYNTYPFDADAASALYLDLFGPVASELASVRHLIFEPDGAMLRLPLNLLITDAASVAAWKARSQAPGGDPFDMRGVAWLGHRTRVSTAVSALAFRNTRNAPPSHATRGYLGMGSNTPVGDVSSVAAVRAGSPDAAIGCVWSIDEWNKPIAPTELYAARSVMQGTGSDVITGNAFTDTQILARSDLRNYRILHFATHGLVTPPHPECPTRPALLTSFDTSNSDGLLTFDEIFDLRIDADLVILSACDTAGQASIAATRAAGVTTGGGSSLDGLVRAFIGAGGRSILASHWPAPDDFRATERLIGGIFSAGGGVSLAEALGQAQDTLMAEASTSHPYYWAGFAIVGDGDRAAIPAMTADAGGPAAGGGQ